MLESTPSDHTLNPGGLTALGRASIPPPGFGSVIPAKNTASHNLCDKNPQTFEISCPLSELDTESPKDHFPPLESKDNGLPVDRKNTFQVPKLVHQPSATFPPKRRVSASQEDIPHGQNRHSPLLQTGRKNVPAGRGRPIRHTAKPFEYGQASPTATPVRTEPHTGPMGRYIQGHTPPQDSKSLIPSTGQQILHSGEIRDVNMIRVLDLDTMFEFKCYTEEGAEHYKKAIELMGHKAYIYREESQND